MLIVSSLAGWVDTVKTGNAKEMPPQSADWFYTRAASIARHVYLRKTVGVGRLRKYHGSAKNRGTRPSRHVNASGSIDRKVMQALEQIGVLEKDEEKGGRRITQQGQRDLDRTSLRLLVAHSFLALLGSTLTYRPMQELPRLVLRRRTKTKRMKRKSRRLIRILSNESCCGIALCLGF